jgi:amidase
MGEVNRYVTLARSAMTGLWVGRRSASSPRLRALDLTPFTEALPGFDDDRTEEVAALVHDASILALSRLMDAGRVTSQEL